MSSHWPHAPRHDFHESGSYIITAATYRKMHFFASNERLELLESELLSLAEEYCWEMQAWAVFSNHYHFVAVSPSDPSNLRAFVQHLHSVTARDVNRLDDLEGRKVWFQYWDTHLTFEKSYLARLNYVYQNPVRHGLVTRAANYPWCSATWFEQRARPAFVRTVSSFKIDQVNVKDDFEVVWDRK